MRGRKQHRFTSSARRRPGQMNKTEARYAARLELLKRAGEIVWWRFEPIKFALAKACYYSPDFGVVDQDGRIYFDEVKGKAGWSLDPESRTKWKVAAELFPFWTFRGAVESKDKSWTVEEHAPRGGFPEVG